MTDAGRPLRLESLGRLAQSDPVGEPGQRVGAGLRAKRAVGRFERFRQLRGFDRRALIGDEGFFRNEGRARQHRGEEHGIEPEHGARRVGRHQHANQRCEDHRPAEGDRNPPRSGALDDRAGGGAGHDEEDEETGPRPGIAAKQEGNGRPQQPARQRERREDAEGSLRIEAVEGFAPHPPLSAVTGGGQQERGEQPIEDVCATRFGVNHHDGGQGDDGVRAERQFYACQRTVGPLLRDPEFGVGLAHDRLDKSAQAQVGRPFGRPAASCAARQRSSAAARLLRSKPRSG